MARAQLTIDLPSSVWISEISSRYPDTLFRVLAAFPAVLRECVAAAGGQLRAEPVAAPPYVVVTSVGPVLRATLDEGRLVVTLRVFAVERPDALGAWYVRRGQSAADVVDVAVRGR